MLSRLGLTLKTENEEGSSGCRTLDKLPNPSGPLFLHSTHCTVILRRADAYTTLGMVLICCKRYINAGIYYCLMYDTGQTKDHSGGKW